MVSGLLCFIKGCLVWGPYKQIKLAQINSLCGVKGSEAIVFRRIVFSHREKISLDMETVDWIP